MRGIRELTPAFQSAAVFLIDPLNVPEPSAETGPGSHFGSTYAPAPAVQKPRITKTPSPPAGRSSIGSNNPFRDGSGSRNASPREAFPAYRSEAFGGKSSHRRAVSNSSNRSAGSQGRSPRAHEGNNLSPQERGHRRRTSSLSARYPGDTSHLPLESIIKDNKKAHRSPHLNKRHLPGPDTIDRLDPALGGRAYHHEGPYDAALLARNSSYKNSPVAALEETNSEALKATPKENIKDALERHKPLDGVAYIPPGMPDRFGRTYNYEEGADLMHEDAPDGPGYKRWAGKVRCFPAQPSVKRNSNMMIDIPPRRPQRQIRAHLLPRSRSQKALYSRRWQWH